MTLPNKPTHYEKDMLLKKLAVILDSLSQYTSDYIDGFTEFCVNEMIELMEKEGYMQ